MATLSQNGIPGSGNGILHPKHKNRYQILFIGMSGTGTNLTRQAITFNRPSLDFEEITLHRYNSIAFVAGKHNWSSTSITIEDDLTGLATAAIQAQLERQQRLIGADGTNGNWHNAAPTASAYKFAMRCEQLDGNETVSEIWLMEGCWIQAADYGELDYSSGDAVQIQLTIRFDHARQQINSAANGSAGIGATAGYLGQGSFTATTG